MLSFVSGLSLTSASFAIPQTSVTPIVNEPAFFNPQLDLQQ